MNGGEEESTPEKEAAVFVKPRGEKGGGRRGRGLLLSLLRENPMHIKKRGGKGYLCRWRFNGLSDNAGGKVGGSWGGGR